MNDSNPKPETTAELASELDRQQAQNGKILHLLSMMELLWPEEEKARVQSLLAQADGTKNALADCAERLEKRK